MDSDKHIMLKILSCAVSIASRAGAQVRNITKTGSLGVVDKGVQDYQTEADRIAQRMIIASLTKRFPKCVIVGEEDLAEDKEADEKLIVDSYDQEVFRVDLPERYKNVKEEDITIWVDPLDGTTEFVKGYLEHVTILIGISVAGKSVAGVIHQPFYQGSDGRTMWGLVGLGCYGVAPKPMPDDKLIITTTASHGSKNIDESIEAIKADEVLRVGGAGHKVLLVIEGRAHSYVFPSNGCKRWDTSAPEAVLKSAGGKLTDINGSEIEYLHNPSGDYQNYTGIVASKNEQIHRRLINSIPESVKSRLSELKPKF